MAAITTTPNTIASNADAPLAELVWAKDPEPTRLVDDVDQLPSQTDVLAGIIDRWVTIALSHSRTVELDQDEGFAATVAGVEGCWGHGSTPEAASDDLASALHGWVELKLADGDNDIPDMEGVRLVPSE